MEWKYRVPIHPSQPQVIPMTQLAFAYFICYHQWTNGRTTRMSDMKKPPCIFISMQRKLSCTCSPLEKSDSYVSTLNNKMDYFYSSSRDWSNRSLAGLKVIRKVQVTLLHPSSKRETRGTSLPVSSLQRQAHKTRHWPQHFQNVKDVINK